ncbi:MAG: response regulator transcription factor [Lachnospiraceae bacterium]|nr:response regulator transcription factor [Lachnospiraceae bacterium]
MIYLVEDDNSIRELVLYTLRANGYENEGFEYPSAFWKAIDKKKPKLIILDIMLPEEDGLSILKKLRSGADTKKIPVIMLTAKSSEYDKVIGLEQGADDYIAKPFGIMELMARIKALLRRTEDVRESVNEYVFNELTVNTTKHKVIACGNEVVLTAKEYELLCLLLENMGTVLSRDTLLNEIWGYSFDGESRTVDVHIRTLRQKLGDCGNYIETIRGFGYKIG